MGGCAQVVSSMCTGDNKCDTLSIRYTLSSSLFLSRCFLSPRSSLLGSALQTSGAQGVFSVGLYGTSAGDVT